MATRKNSTKDLAKNASDLIKEALKKRRHVDFAQLNHIEFITISNFPKAQVTGTTFIINIGTGARPEAIKWLCENY